MVRLRLLLQSQSTFQKKVKQRSKIMEILINLLKKRLVVLQLVQLLLNTKLKVVIMGMLTVLDTPIMSKI